MPITVDTYALTDEARVKRALSKADLSGIDNDQIVEAINYVSASMESFCNRGFRSRTYIHDGAASDTPRLTGTGTENIWLQHMPVTSVTTLKLTPDSDALTEGWDEDFVVHPGEGRIELLNQTSGRTPMAIEVTYVGGFVATTASAGSQAMYGYHSRAADVEGAAVEQIVHVFRRMKDKETGLQSFSTEGGTFTFNNDAWLPHVLDVLRHRRVL